MKKIKRIKTKLTNKLSKKNDLTWNRPITLVTPFYLFQSVLYKSGEMQTMNIYLDIALSQSKASQS